jgi:hypothetical protein
MCQDRNLPPRLLSTSFCVKLGYCLPPNEREAILSDPPADTDAFVHAVLVAEGLDPTWVTKPQRDQMIEVVTKFL